MWSDNAALKSVACERSLKYCRKDLFHQFASACTSEECHCALSSAFLMLQLPGLALSRLWPGVDRLQNAGSWGLLLCSSMALHYVCR